MQTNKKKELVRVVRFTLFSASAGLIEFGSFAALSALTAWSYWPRYLIRRWFYRCCGTSRSTASSPSRAANNVPKAMALVLLYYAVFTPTSTVLGSWLTDTLGWNDYLVTVLNMLLNFGTEYLYDRLVVFRGSIDTGVKTA